MRRQPLAAVTAAIALTLAAGTSCGLDRQAQVARGGHVLECPGIAAPDFSARRVRGMWIATVANTDWPSRSGLPAGTQKAEYRRLLDTARALNLNAVFVQIRPAADAFYPSPYEPWSQWLSGTQGRDPGYDVLKFMLDEAHSRDLEFHAWFNPFRVSKHGSLRALAPANPARRHPGWVRRYGGGLWLDPGLPQVRDHVTRVVLDVLARYDIDGVHFDDYFYPYPANGQGFPDTRTHREFGGGMSRAAWRRRNVDVFVEGMSQRIHRAKPWVQFGISPFGVWRNRSTDPGGSATRALQSYDDIYADTRMWVRRGWLDYITPQLYWPIGDARADYRTLVEWWSHQVAGTAVRLTIGQAAYRVAEGPGVWKPAQLAGHLAVNAGHRAVWGDVFFSATDLAEDRAGFATWLRKSPYRRPAIIPVMREVGKAPWPASGVRARSAGPTSVRVHWQGSGATSYAVYRTAGKAAACAPVAPARLLATVRGTVIVDQTVRPGTTYTYYVTALDRLHHESPPGRGSTITAQRG